MKIFLFLVSLFASTLYAEMFDQSEISYSYDIEMNNDTSIIKYHVDSSYYDQFSAEVLGVYIIHRDVPTQIFVDLKKMAQILDRYINLSSSYDFDKEITRFNLVISTDVFNQFSHKYINNHPELRDINRILKSVTNYKDSLSLFYELDGYINKKRSLYKEQNNKEGISFCNEIEKTIIRPLVTIISSIERKNKTIDQWKIGSLNKRELKIFWDKFKDRKLGLIQSYFDANDEKLVQLDRNNTFKIDSNYAELYGWPKFYICLRIFGQKWYLKMDDYYTTKENQITLIEL